MMKRKFIYYINIMFIYRIYLILDFFKIVIMGIEGSGRWSKVLLWGGRYIFGDVILYIFIKCFF